MKKTVLLLSLVPLFFIPAKATRAQAGDIPMFQGMVADDKLPQFGLSSADKTKNAWLKIGQNFDGWKLAAYDRENKCLVLTKDGREEKISLASGNLGIVATKATRADAAAAIKAMKIGKLTQSILNREKKRIAKTIKGELVKAGLADPTPEQVAAAQKIALKEVSEEFSGKKMEAAFTDVFAEVYSKEELRAQTDFFESPDGKAVFKAIGENPASVDTAMKVFCETPVGQSTRSKQKMLDKKTLEVLLPRVATVQMNTQKALREYVATQK